MNKYRTAHKLKTITTISRNVHYKVVDRLPVAVCSSVRFCRHPVNTSTTSSDLLKLPPASKVSLLPLSFFSLSSRRTCISWVLWQLLISWSGCNRARFSRYDYSFRKYQCHRITMLHNFNYNCQLQWLFDRDQASRHKKAPCNFQKMSFINKKWK